MVVEVKDNVIWLKHLHGDAGLASFLAELNVGEVKALRVDGFEGFWEKMADGKDGRPTPGIKPIGKARDHWNQLFVNKRGDVVEIEVLP